MLAEIGGMPNILSRITPVGRQFQSQNCWHHLRNARQIDDLQCAFVAQVTDEDSSKESDACLIIVV